jgi:hypothetical protein
MAQKKRQLRDIINVTSCVQLGDMFDEAALRITEKGDGFLLQLVFNAADVETGLLETQYCRKWYVSPYSTETEIVETAFKAVRTAMEHEVREKFHYHGVAVFNPHVSVRARMELKARTNLDIREPLSE